VPLAAFLVVPTGVCRVVCKREIEQAVCVP